MAVVVKIEPCPIVGKEIEAVVGNLFIQKGEGFLLEERIVMKRIYLSSISVIVNAGRSNRQDVISVK